MMSTLTPILPCLCHTSSMLLASFHHQTLFPSVCYPLVQVRNFQVRCLAEEEPKEQLPATPSTSPPAPKVSKKFSDVLAFSGPATERINGRLAMVGFVAALAMELPKG